MVEEILDKYRTLELTIDSWLYFVDDPSVKIQQTTNKFPYKEEFPFKNTKEEWISEITNIIIARLTQTMINEFGNRGICKYSNETQCSPSINWDYEITNSSFHYKIDKEKIEKIKENLRKYEEQRKQILIKRQKAQEKAEQKKKTQLEKLQKKADQRPKPEPITVPVIIDETPTTITFKKELTTMDVVQISRLHKSIAKLEKIKVERQSFIDMYNERIKSERLDLLLSSTKQRDEWQDIIDITNIKIERQKEAIERIKI